MKKAYSIALFALLVGLAGAFAFGNFAKTKEAPAEILIKENRDGTYSVSEDHMGKTFTIIVADKMSEEKAKPHLKAAFAVIAQIAKMIDGNDPASAVSVINANAGAKPVKVDDYIFDMISRAVEVANITNGAFDITFASVGDLWNYRKIPFTVPKDEDVKSRIKLVNYKNIVLNEKEKTVFLKEKGMKIGLRGIAKGYATDMVTEQLEKAGLHNFIIYAGGDVMARGYKGDRSWRIGVQDPFSPENYFATMPINNRSVSTSGAYEMGVEVDGKFYHHIIDPKTGYPATGTLQVTLISDYATYTDALCTGIFVLGPNVAIPILERMTGVDAVIIDDEGNVYITSRLKEKLNIKEQYFHKPEVKKEEKASGENKIEKIEKIDNKEVKPQEKK